MPDSSNNAASGGIGFAGLLTIAFIVLKLCGVITWPWIWVVCPLWIPVAVVLVVILVMLFFWLALKSWG